MAVFSNRCVDLYGFLQLNENRSGFERVKEVNSTLHTGFLKKFCDDVNK